MFNRNYQAVLLGVVGLLSQSPAFAWQAGSVTISGTPSYAAGSWAAGTPHLNGGYAAASSDLPDTSMVLSTSGDAIVVFSRTYTKEAGDGNVSIDVTGYATAEYWVSGLPGLIGGTGEARARGRLRVEPEDPGVSEVFVNKIQPAIAAYATDSGSGNRTWGHVLSATTTISFKAWGTSSAAITGTGSASANGYAACTFQNP